MHADLAMNGLQRWRPYHRIMRGEVYALRLLRRTEFWESRHGVGARLVTTILKVRLRRQCERLGFELPRGVVGPGFSIAHSGLLVIANNARVGARCRIHHGVTIGRGKEGSAPVIGDDVFIGPNAVVLGPITVGDGAMIYPNAVVTHDVPPGHAARGVPAVVVPMGQPMSWRP
jgi:serine O-acetyltransferase